MVADGAGGQLEAVTDEVVLVRENIERVLGHQRFHTALRHRERIM